MISWPVHREKAHQGGPASPPCVDHTQKGAGSGPPRSLSAPTKLRQLAPFARKCGRTAQARGAETKSS